MDTFRKQETLKPYFEQSYGCATFSTVAKGGVFFVGGAYGAGDIYKLNGGVNVTKVGRVDLVQAIVGWVLGGEVYSEIYSSKPNQIIIDLWKVISNSQRRPRPWH